jgi:ribosome biogenesis GTPase
VSQALLDLGWGPFFAAQVGDKQQDKKLVPGRAAFESRGIYHVMTEQGQLTCELRGVLRKGGRDHVEYPVVGDWVLYESMGKNRGMIVRTLKRRNALTRRELPRGEEDRRGGSLQILAANVDWGLITSSANDEWNPRRLERYLGLVKESGAKPALLLTKVDLTDDNGEAIAAEAQALAPNLVVLRLNALKDEGLAPLKALLKAGETAVLIGSSGVGKSTLVNALLGEHVMATGEIREKDSRGRHTTVGRHLLPLPWGACLIDSPGLRDLGLTDEAAVAATFEDIEALAATCRFSDCKHETEPGCAVAAALEDGSLDSERYDGFVKLRQETAIAARKKLVSSVRLEKERGKVGAKALKSYYKDKGKR